MDIALEAAEKLKIQQRNTGENVLIMPAFPTGQVGNQGLSLIDYKRSEILALKDRIEKLERSIFLLMQDPTLEEKFYLLQQY